MKSISSGKSGIYEEKFLREGVGGGASFGGPRHENRPNVA